MASEEEMLPDRTDSQELDAGLRRGHCQLVLVSLKGHDEAGYGRVKKMANFSYWNHLSLSGRGLVAMGMLTATQVCRKEYLSLFSPPVSLHYWPSLSGSSWQRRQVAPHHKAENRTVDWKLRNHIEYPSHQALELFGFRVSFRIVKVI